MLTRTASTRINAKATPKETKVTIDFTGVSQEDMEKLAAATVIITEQAMWRTSEVIPSEATIKVAEQLSRPRGQGGFKPTPENMAARIEKQSKEDFQKTLELLGLPANQVAKMVAAKFKE